MVTSLRTRVKRSLLREAISSIPQEFSQGSTNQVQSILDEAAQALLEKIREAFLTKSAGGTDESGDKWVPLKSTTVAYSRSTRTRTENAHTSRPSQGLSARNQKRWWDLYRQGLAIYKGDKAQAAKRAWGILKRQGVTTLLDKYGSRRVSILYNTGALFDSITSRVDSRGVTISSNHPTAIVHHKGSINKGIPQRKLWPDPEDIPQGWWQAMVETIRDGIIEIIKQRVR